MPAEETCLVRIGPFWLFSKIRKEKCGFKGLVPIGQAAFDFFSPGSMLHDHSAPIWGTLFSVYTDNNNRGFYE